MDTTGIVQVGDVEALIRTLAASSPDRLLLDWSLYGSSATDSCRLLQKAFPHLKIVLPSVNAEGEAATKEAGADFIHKGAPSDELIATLTPLLRKNTYANDPEVDTGGD